MKFLSYVVLFVLCLVFTGCQKKFQTSQQTVSTFYYPAMPEYGIKEAHVCREQVHEPYFTNLGITCLCKGSEGLVDSGSFSHQSKKQGYSYECKSVSEYQRDVIESNQRYERSKVDEEAKKMAEELARKQEWERNRPIREAEARKRNEQLNRICPIYYVARQSCANAGNYANCMNIRLNNNYQNWLDVECFNM